jgi:hypothetical protein
MYEENYETILMSNVQLFAFVDDARTVQTECRELALC